MEEKTKKSFFDNFVFYTLTVLLLVFGGQILAQLIFLPVILLTSGTNEMGPELSIALDYFMTIGVWITCLLWFLFRKNRYMYSEITPKKRGNNILMFIIGCVIGFGMNAICVLVAYLRGDIGLEFDSVKIGWLILVAICVLIQSSSEELVCRVYLYQKLKNRYKNPLIAIIGNSVLFSLLHIFNPGLTIVALINIVLIGIFFSLFVYYFDSVWCAFTIHAAWNFTQNIIFGLPNSGNLSPFSVFKLVSARDTFAYDRDFGVEGTIMSLIVEVVGIALVILIGRKFKSKKANLEVATATKDNVTNAELVK